MSDNNKQSNDAFSWIFDIPLGVAIVDEEKNTLLAYNSLFFDMIAEETGVSQMDTLSFVNEIPKDDILVMIVEILYDDNKSLAETASVKKIEYENKPAWLCIFKYVFDDYLPFEDRFDPETGMYTKAAGMELLAQHMDEAKYRDKTLSVAHITLAECIDENERTDLSGEKLGHIIDLIYNSIRGSDILAHLEPSKFIFVFPNCPSEVAESILITILNRLILVGADNIDDPTNIEFAHNIIEVTADSDLHTPRDVIDKVKETMKTEIISF